MSLSGIFEVFYCSYFLVGIFVVLYSVCETSTTLLIITHFEWSLPKIIECYSILYVFISDNSDYIETNYNRRTFIDFFHKNVLKLLQYKMLYGIIFKQSLRKGVYGMSNKNAVNTTRKPLFGNKRSHSLRSSRRRWNINTQKATIMVDGKPTKVRISARELKALKAQGRA